MLERDKIFGIDQAQPLERQFGDLARLLLGSPAAALGDLAGMRSFFDVVQHLGERVRFPAAART